MYEIQKNSMADYYQKMVLKGGRLTDASFNNKFFAIQKTIFDETDAFYKENPDTPTTLLKSRLHKLMAKYFEPVIFEQNPFFFEMGMREADSWGLSDINPGMWLKKRISEKIHMEHRVVPELEKEFAPVFDLNALGLCSADSSFDGDHHTLGYTNMFKYGLNGLIRQATEQMDSFDVGSDAYYFCLAAIESCQAVIAIAEKFADAAAAMLAERTNECTDEHFAEREKHYLTMIAESARYIPANPPRTFYEGLAFLLFTREIASTLEAIGVSQLGHVDRLLGPLYEADIAAGRITEEEARELIGIWMLHTDIKFDLEHNSWPETSTCIQLGGCDENGTPIFNTVTRMFMEEHHKLGLINPKLNCRYSSDSPDEFLKAAGEIMLKGHNNFVMINDEIIIPGLIKSGVDEKDARLCVNGGCQETMIEGFGHTEGVAFYASMPRVLDLFLQGDGGEFVKAKAEYDSFDAFYADFMDALKGFFYKMIDWRNTRQQYYKQLTVAPFFSATQTGCIENGMDYSHGGAKYNFSTISLIGLGTLADSLYAVKALVFDQKKVTLNELSSILKTDWEGNELLQRLAVALPKYGHNDKDADAMAAKFLSNFNGMLNVKTNERGGTYIPSLFVYYHFETFARCLRATPDGRKAYELISAGAAPGNLRPIKDVTTPVKSMQNVDFTMCGGGSAVLDVKLPLSKSMNAELFTAFIRACGSYHCPTIQPNVVSQEELLDAKVHPENHKNLIVRICGLSAYFVALTNEVQDEIIARNMYSM